MGLAAFNRMRRQNAERKTEEEKVKPKETEGRDERKKRSK